MVVWSRTSNARGLRVLAAPLPSGELDFAELWGGGGDDTIIDGRSWGWRCYRQEDVVILERCGGVLCFHGMLTTFLYLTPTRSFHVQERPSPLLT